MTSMRRVALVLLLVAASLIAIGAASGGETTRARESAGDGVTVRLEHGWRVIRRLVRLRRPGVLASFPAAFAGHPCPCATPNYRNCGGWCTEPRIRNFPMEGVLVF